MASYLQICDELVAAASGRSSLSWHPVFDQHVPTRVLSAVSCTDGFVVLSGESGVAPTVVAAVAAQMREAGFEVATVMAPLSGASVLYEVIREAFAAKPTSERSLLLIVEQAEELSMQTMQQLVTLAKLRHDDRPVLRFLLTSTPALWSILHGVDLGGLEHDAAAHVRLMPDLIRYLPEPPQVADGHRHEPGLPRFDYAAVNPRQQSYAFPSPALIAGAPYTARRPLHLRESRARRRAALLLIGLTLAGLASGGAIWTLPAPRPDRHAASAPIPLSSPDDRLASLLDRENQEIAARHKLPGGDLVETRRQIDEILPQVSSGALRALAVRPAMAATGKPVSIVAPALGRSIPAPDASGRMAQAEPLASAPAARSSDRDASAAVVVLRVGAPVDAPPPGPMHVTLHYSRGDSAAAARAMRIRTLLHGQGVPVDGPEPADHMIERSSLAYYFAQDQTTALDLAQHLSPRVAQVHELAPSGGRSLPRPGEISISIGSGDVAGPTRPSGNRT